MVSVSSIHQSTAPKKKPTMVAPLRSSEATSSEPSMPTLNMAKKARM